MQIASQDNRFWHKKVAFLVFLLYKYLEDQTVNSFTVPITFSIQFKQRTGYELMNATQCPTANKRIKFTLNSRKISFLKFPFAYFVGVSC